ncbi:hypothetical protein AC578_712 [Pseudocercospora eumusae]|uniref:Uncharacterized protein n=1 Tax=Pseudocercospora eumusae TaxID=321146 RepID=A0A139HN44_9PEZI|nr:hypothetical protein AC578_712 [Pseudocercospora eumusae]
MKQATRICRALIKRSAELASPLVHVSRAYTKMIARSQEHRRDQQTHDDEQYFAFTRYRFVQNEAHEMAARYVRFQVEELKKVAAAAVRSESCVKFEKFPEGAHSKAFLLTMNDGKRAVAKIPNPVAGQAHFTTASEVATMSLMRNSLGLPVPQVYAWCSRAAETPVCAEYIIMSEADGVPLESFWKRMKLSDRIQVVKEIAECESKWCAAKFEGYGSIYFANDLESGAGLPLGHFNSGVSSSQPFALGPTTGRDWADAGRLSVEFNRGPWRTLNEYMEAIGEREMASVRTLPRLPPSRYILYGPGTYQTTREKKLRAIEYYLRLYRHLLPPDSAIQRPSAWHTDLHAANIYVDPANPTKITSIIDWQSTEVAPLFVQARQPYFLDHAGPQTKGLDRPERPSNFPELSREEQWAADWLLLDQNVCVAYRMWTQGVNSDLWKSLEFHSSPEFMLLMLARALLEGGEATFTSNAVDYLKSNPEVLQEISMSLTEEFVAEVETDAEGETRGIDAMDAVKEAMGHLFPKDGASAKNLQAAKRSVLLGRNHGLSTTRIWPNINKISQIERRRLEVVERTTPSGSNVSEVEADTERARYGMHLMNEVKAATGDLFPVHGCVKAGNYIATKEILRHYKEQVIGELADIDAERAVWEDMWPWDD